MYAFIYMCECVWVDVHRACAEAETDPRELELQAAQRCRARAGHEPWSFLQKPEVF